MKIPSRGRARWASEIIGACTASRAIRVQRGSAYRNLFLTGDENGVPQTFLRTQDFIRDVQAFLYSPSDLRFSVDYFGQVSPVERAKGHAAAAGLYQHICAGDVDDAISDAVLWSLIKGKTIEQIVWSRGGFEPYLVQPESFGVFNESIASLERQEAFVHTTFPTRSRFKQIISGLPEARQEALMRAATNMQTKTQGGPDSNSMLKQILVGGLYPYTTSGTSPSTNAGRVMHLFAPQAQIETSVQDQMVPMDELWVWNDEQDDWATITMIGDEIVFGGEILFNAFAEPMAKRDAYGRVVSDDSNPLRGQHGFTEFCAMPLPDNFWGISFISLVALLQRALNERIDGINKMLRKQEDPPRFATGSTSVNQNAYAKLNKPGGFFTDGSPNAKMQEIVAQIPPDIWRSFQELNSMFDVIGGMPAIMRGEGEGSVRSQGQSDTLLRTGSARHKDASLKIERSVERIGGLCFSMLRAKCPDQLIAWVPPGTKSVQLDTELDPTLEPPAPGMLPVTFNYADVSPKAKIEIDSHSSSPAFRHESRELAFALAKAGAIDGKRLIEMVHPPMEDALVEDLERKDIAQQALIAQHPELLTGKKSHH